MATDLEKLVVSLEANIKKFEREMARSRGVVSKALGDAEREVTRRGKAIENAFGLIASRAKQALGALAAGISFNELRKAADEYTKIVNTLKVAGVSGGALPGVLDQLFASAQRNAVPLDALAQLYGRVSQAQTTLKASSQDLIGLTDIVAQSLRVGGTSATEASGALLQLGQALSGGKIQAEEYNSLLDGMYPLLRAAAAGIQEAGGDVSKLTALVKDGKVSSEAFFRGIQAGAPLLQQQLSGAADTTEQAMTRLRNEFVKAAGEFDKAVGLTPALVSGLNQVAGSIGGVGEKAAEATNQVVGLLKALGEVAASSGAALTAALNAAQTDTAKTQRTILEAKLRAAVGPERAGIEAQLRALDQGAQNQSAKWARAADERERFIAAGKDIGDLTRQGTGIGVANAPQPPSRPAGIGGADIKPISLANYKVPGDSSGSGGAASKEKLDAYQKELIQIEKRTKALQLEADMVGKSTFEREKARAALELETAAKKANLPITEEMRRTIEASATGYANAKVKVEEVTRALEAAQDAQRFFGDAITDSLGDLILNGEKAQDVLKNLVKQLAKAALQAALMGSGPLAGLFGTAGSNGNVGGLFGSLFGGFRANGGPVSPGKAYVVGEKRPEMFVPSTAGRIVPSVPTVSARQGAAGGLTVNVQNNTPAQVETKPRSDGGVDMVISQIEGALAQRFVRGQGSLSQAFGARQTGRQLRG